MESTFNIPISGKYTKINSLNLLSLNDENEKWIEWRTHVDEAVLLRFFSMSQHCLKKKSITKINKSNIDKQRNTQSHKRKSYRRMRLRQWRERWEEWA